MSSQPDFQAMAELRYQIRRFMRFSENAAHQAGLEPQQYQLLLAVKGLPSGMKPNINVLSHRMQLQHHSTVGLVDRLVERGLLVRFKATEDRRHVLVKVTAAGEEYLRRLASFHLHEINSVGPDFVSLLQRLLEHTPPPHQQPITRNKQKNGENNG